MKAQQRKASQTENRDGRKENDAPLLVQDNR
jgi:hypothetical protein